MEQNATRKHERTPVLVAVDWQVAGTDDAIFSASGDISYGGVRIKTLTPPDVGTAVDVKLGREDTPAGKRRVPARVAWVRMDEEFCGMGLVFEPECDEDAQDLIEFVDRVRQRGTGRSA